MATAVQSALYAQSQRAHHQLGLSLLLNLAPSSPFDMTPTLPGHVDESLGANPNRPLTINLQTNQYNPIIHDFSPSSANAALGLSLPFPPQANMNDMKNIFTRHSDRRNQSLPMMSGGSMDGSPYGYNTTAEGSNSSYVSSSLPSYSNVYAREGGGTWTAQSPGLSPNTSTGKSSLVIPDVAHNFSAVPPGTSPQNLQTMYSNGTTDSSSYPSTQSSYMFVNPWQLGNAAPQDTTTSQSPPLQPLPAQGSYQAFTPRFDVSTSLHPRQSSNEILRSASAKSAEQDSWDSLSADDEFSEQRLTAEDMADADELAELRELEQGGASRRADRRRMRNKLAQRAFRARAKVTKKDAASRLVQVEASNTNQNKELDLLRELVHTLHNENAQLKRQMKESKRERRISTEGEGSGTQHPNVKVEQQDESRDRKRSREKA